MEDSSSQYKVPIIEKGGNNSRNIPTVIFIENVDDYLERFGYDLILKELNTAYRLIAKKQVQVHGGSDRETQLQH